MNKPDLDIKIQEIKELVTTPDYDTIDKGVALARELNEPAVFEHMLEGCSINIESDYNFPLIPNELFQGDDHNQHFLNYALLNLIGYAPENADIDHSITKDALTLLQVTTKVEKFPIGICSLINVVKINFYNCSLKNLPPEIGNLKKLEDLNLSGNNIAILPDEIGELACLKKLFLDGNNLKTLPETIQQLTNLDDNGGLWIWDMDDLKVPENIQEFVQSKIMVVYIFQLELIRWGYKHNIIDYEPAPEDLQENSTNEPMSDWYKLLVDIAKHPDCPIEFLTKFIEPYEPSDDDEYLELSFSDLVIDTAFQHPNLMGWLKPSGFGRFANPETGEKVAKMKDGKLVAIKQGEKKIMLNTEIISPKWNFKTAGEVSSSPVVSEGVVYFGSRDNHFYAVDSKTGEEKWKFKTGGEVISTPAVSDGVVYFGSKDNHLYAVDIKDGKEKWKFITEHWVVSSPAVTDNMIYFGSNDQHLYALNKSTGKNKWDFDTGKMVTSSPKIYNDSVYVGVDKLYAFDRKSGKVKWIYETGGGTINEIIILNGIIYFGSVHIHLYLVDANTGNELWKFKIGIGVLNENIKYTPGDFVSSPMEVSDDMVCFGSMVNYWDKTEPENHLFVVDIKNRVEKWRFFTGGEVSSAPAASGDVIYIGSNDTYLYALDKNTGEKLWKFKTEKSIESSAPAVSEGVIYFGSKDNYLYAVQDPYLVEWLKPAGFGRYADPDTGEVIAKMQDGKLVPVEKAE